MFWLALIAVVFYLVYKYIYKPPQCFREHNIPYISFGEIMKNTFKIIKGNLTAAQTVRDYYDAFPGHRFIGMCQFATPIVFVRDPNLVKQMAIKDFDNFTDHQSFDSGIKDDILLKNIFALKGNTWREMRATLSPAFTSGKIRGMYRFMNDCGRSFVEFFEKKEEEIAEVDFKDVCSKFANDVIASSAFGIQCNSLDNPENEFFKMGKQLTDFGVFTQLKFVLFAFFPFLVKRLKVSILPKAVSVFFQSIITETIKIREEQHIVRPDMIHLLTEARKGRLVHESEKDSDVGFATAEESNVGKSGRQKQMITDVDICGQALIFFLAGFDTVSRSMSFMAMELCRNSDVQRKLQEEIDEVLAKTGGDVTYEDILGMKYMDQVVSETLRLWAPAPQTDRVCVKDYRIEPEKAHERPFHMKKGDVMIIPVAGFHFDPLFFPNPNTFDPDRFSDENKKNVVPGTYLPFGIGPRNCIGSRFALLEMKVVFFHLLSKFDLCFTQKTILPLEIISVGFNPMPKGGFKFGLQRRREPSM